MTSDNEISARVPNEGMRSEFFFQDHETKLAADFNRLHAASVDASITLEHI